MSIQKPQKDSHQAIKFTFEDFSPHDLMKFEQLLSL